MDKLVIFGKVNFVNFWSRKKFLLCKWLNKVFFNPGVIRKKKIGWNLKVNIGIYERLVYLNLEVISNFYCDFCE